MEPTKQSGEKMEGGMESKPGQNQSLISANAPPFVPSVNPMSSNTGKSKALSPHAPVFYPKNYFKFMPQPVIPEQNDEAGKRKSNEDALDELRAAIHLLIIDPGRFEQIMPYLVRKLASLVSYGGGSLAPLIEEIFTQSVYEVNFRYTGARMCSYFSQRPELAFYDFQREFLLRCEKEYEIIAFRNYSPLSHVTGYILFVGELLLSMRELNSNQVIPQFPHQIGNILMYLLSDRSREAILCCVQLLKLTGAVLEDSLHNLNEIFEKIEAIVKDKDTAQNVVNMLQSVINHRMNSWGQRASDPLISSGAGDSIDSQLDESTIVNLDDDEFYNSHSFSSDERDMVNLIEDCEGTSLADQYWIGDEKMDDETASAFEQFVAETQFSSASASQSRSHGPGAGRK